MRALTAVALVASFVLIAAATTLEGAFVVVFGWAPFLARVILQVEPDGPSVVVGLLALVVFGCGVHWLGWSWRGSARPPSERWRVRWTAAVVLGVILLFTAGIAIVGISHQVAWLATSEQPIVGQGIVRDGNPKMIAIGLSTHHDAEGRFPPGGTFSTNGEMLHSWETAILPHMGYSLSGIDMNRPWNGSENERYFKCVLPDFINPAFRTPPLEDGSGFGLSHYAANSKVLPIEIRTSDKPTKRPGIARGTSNTILAGEVNAGFRPWGHPVNARDPAVGLTGGTNAFGGPVKNNGTTFVMADGSVRFIRNSVDPAVLAALSSPSAGE